MVILSEYILNVIPFILVVGVIIYLFIINKKEERITPQVDPTIEVITYPNNIVAVNELFIAINKYRRFVESPELNMPYDINKIAYEHSNWMANSKRLSNDNIKSRSIRLKKAGYKRASENVAVGYKNPNDILNAWKANLPNNVVMTDKDFDMIGIAIVTRDGVQYCTAIFCKTQSIS